MAAWTTRLTDGFKRSLDNAWGKTRGKGKVEFKVFNIQGSMPLDAEGEYHCCMPPSPPIHLYHRFLGPTVSFLSLPDIMDMVASMEFNPRAGAIDTHTLEFGLALGSCSAKVDLVNTLLKQLKPDPSPPPSRLRPNAPQIDLGSPLYSSFAFPSGSISASIQSALPSFASSFFSPTNKSGSASALLSPTSGKILSPTSLRSPASPFFRVFSVSSCFLLY
jgi:hypothetical protein